MERTLRLKGKRALVTGGSRSLGYAIAQALIDEGATVVVTARDRAAVDAAVGRLGPSAAGFACDIGDATQVGQLFGVLEARLGGLDILVNNAAVGLLHRIEQATDAELETEIRTNLFGPIHCIRAAVPSMRRAGGGEIVSISSESVTMPFPLLTTYAATKAALETLSRGLRAELSPDNIRVSVLRAGAIADSGFGTGWTAEQQADAFALWQKTGHLAMVGQHRSIEAPVIARAVADMVALPSSGAIDLLELRAR